LEKETISHFEGERQSAPHIFKFGRTKTSLDGLTGRFSWLAGWFSGGFCKPRKGKKKNNYSIGRKENLKSIT
jgi:hypothetical protein